MVRKSACPIDHCPAPFLDEKRGYLVDWLTQIWVKAARRRITLDDEWLVGPAGSTRGIGEEFYREFAEKTNQRLTVDEEGSGLVETMASLVDREQLDPRIAEFYEQTSRYRMEVTSQWCGLFYPFGWLLAFVFSRRLQQLNVPLSCRRARHEFTSQIVMFRDANGARGKQTGWLRRRVDDGRVVYVGMYGHGALKDGTPVLKLTFPLPNGSATVLMKGHVQSDRSLLLSAAGRRFGDPGFYFVVNGEGGAAHARYVRSVHERIHVFLKDGDLTAEHDFKLWGLRSFRLQYRMQKLVQ